MYLTAQHVRSVRGQEGINAFCYLHGAHVWQGLPPQGIPDQDPGALVADVIAVPPPGNRVRSFLDLVSPDDASWAEIRPAFMAFLSEAQGARLPWVGVVGRCLFRVDMDQALAARWRGEIAALYRALQQLRPSR